LPEGVTLGGADERGPSRGPPRHTPSVVPMPASSGVSAATGEADGIVQALSRQGLTLVAKLPLEPAPATTVRAAAGPLEVAVEVDLAPDEAAVILIEQDGVYTWNFDGVAAAEAGPSAAGARRGLRAQCRRRVVFKLPLGTLRAGESKRRGWLSDLIIERAQALVFKFAGRFLLGRGIEFLERDIQSGIVAMNGADPNQWTRIADFSTLSLPSDRPSRVLLFVHGTFSSTKGGFAGLCATPWGRAFLAAARANYDAVVGFDHPTLSVDPLVNATALIRCLEARRWTQPMSVDAVSHSRGGIMLRSLMEYLLPAASLPVRVERAVFVGAVNGGTQLAEPKNWRSLINLYTNLAVGTCRAIAKFPHATFAAMLTAELLKGLGLLVKVLSEEAVSEDVAE
jgi:hypothetical protein